LFGIQALVKKVISDSVFGSKGGCNRELAETAHLKTSRRRHFSENVLKQKLFGIL